MIYNSMNAGGLYAQVKTGQAYEGKRRGMFTAVAFVVVIIAIVGAGIAIL